MTVERLYRCSAIGGPMEACAELTLIAGQGIVGDRYYGRQDAPGQNLTLIEADVIEAFLASLSRPLDLAISRRNVVTRGTPLNALVGREFMLGPVYLRGVELCEPCRGLGRALSGPDITAADVVRRLTHLGGLRADILNGGILGLGDALREPPPAG